MKTTTARKVYIKADMPGYMGLHSDELATVRLRHLPLPALIPERHATARRIVGFYRNNQDKIVCLSIAFRFLVDFLL